MEDSKAKLKIIQQLMDQIQDEMQYGEDDLAERLGRKKPGIEVVKIEGKLPGKMGDMSEMHDMDDMEKMEESTGKDLDHDMEMGEDPEHASKVLGESDDYSDSSPEEMLKKRLMKLRG